MHAGSASRGGRNSREGKAMDCESRCLSVVRAVWSEVLERQDLDPNAHFFELGGDSLAAMRVAARVYDALGIEVPVRILFENPELRQFASRLSGLLAEEHRDPSPS